MTLTLNEATTFLAPTRVVGTEGGRIRVALPDRHVWARLAIPYLYQAAVGDEVLTIGRPTEEGGEAFFVIGVLESAGPARLTVPADFTLSAPHGAIRLDSGEAVALEAPRVELRAGAIEMVARSLTQRLENAYQWVRELFHLDAGRSRSVIAGASYHQAERTVIKAEKDVSIDGDKILLG